MEKAPEVKKKMNRREFLKQAGGYAAATVGLLGLSKLGAMYSESVEKQQLEDKEHEKIGAAVVIKKVYEPKKTETQPRGTILPGVPLTTIHEVEEKFKVTVKIGEKESVVEVTKDYFDSLKIDDKIPVKYDDRTMVVKSIENPQ